ncbi:hypothetical protein EV426DRAFT_564633 [Tirmania nivea]|nr:hypothetical protein EV426DRAFT_564633 [Tirmania nivea]
MTAATTAATAQNSAPASADRQQHHPIMAASDAASDAPPPRPKRPTCLHCPSPAKIKRPKNGHPLCVTHFLSAFEAEILHTIQSTSLFAPGETVAIGASGGKDSTVLAAVLTTLNARHSLGLTLHLLSIDEGIAGYRDRSLAAVQRNALQYGLPLTVLSYRDLYGWTMDSIVAAVGTRSNCTYCGVFRRQALDRGCELLGIAHVVTGHNADDMAETVLMNLLRGDLPRLARCTAVTTHSGAGAGAPSTVRRSKPMKYAYQKEIVLYAHHRKLDYFTTECTYAPEAFRGSARGLVKALERVRPSAILDVVRSGEAFAGLLGRPECACGAGAESKCQCSAAPQPPGECGSSAAGEMRMHEAQLRAKPRRVPAETRRRQQVLGRCAQCGYLSSQELCQACVMLQGLNRGRARLAVEIEVEEGGGGAEGKGGGGAEGRGGEVGEVGVGW